MDITKILVVDDSPTMCNIITQILQTNSKYIVVGTACDPYDAREKIKLLKPDVITLDVEMPKMDGITFIEKLMRLHPLPVVLCSSLADEGSYISLKALELGAIDFIKKPTRKEDFEQFASALLDGVSVAAVSNINALTQNNKAQSGTYQKLDNTTIDLIAIGASTGGTEAIHKIFSEFEKDTPPPPIVVTQHLPPSFVQLFADSLNTATSIKTIQAEDGMILAKGFAYIARGEKHMEIIKNRDMEYEIKLTDSELIMGHRPSVDVMFSSISKLNSCKNILAILLTGMGADGASGLLKIKNAGGITVAQDKDTSIVWGMPKSAVELSAAKFVLPLMEIASMAKSYG